MASAESVALLKYTVQMPRLFCRTVAKTAGQSGVDSSPYHLNLFIYLVFRNWSTTQRTVLKIKILTVHSTDRMVRYLHAVE